MSWDSEISEEIASQFSQEHLLDATLIQYQVVRRLLKVKEKAKVLGVTPVTAFCAWCQQAFKQERRCKLFCSVACRDAKNSSARYTKSARTHAVCKWCSTRFALARRIGKGGQQPSYCGERCRLRHRRERQRDQQCLKTRMTTGRMEDTRPSQS